MFNLEINGYQSFHLYGNKSSGTKKGRYSGGISVYFKDEFSSNISIVETHKYGIIWLKINKDLLDLEENVYICNAYIPPPGSKVLYDKDFDFFF